MLLGNTRVRIIALSGILLALAVIFVLSASLLPSGKLALYSIASFTVAIIVIEAGASFAWIYYIASSALIFLIVADKLAVFPYIFFFGFYGIIKFYLEAQKRWKSRIAEYVLKLLVFNICMALGVIIFLEISGLNVSGILSTELPWQIVILLAEVVFLIYDYAFTSFISYYNINLRKRLGK
jgi:hypothetical protein